MLKKRVVAAVAAALMAGGVSAVEVNPGGRGDLLLAPLVMVAGGWESELRIVNTDTVNSVVAKVAFHAPVRSEEILDFFVYLTPGDVWRGTVVKNADGTLGVRSTDDSSLLSSFVNGCPVAPSTSGFDPSVVKSTIAVDTAYVKVWHSAVVYDLGNAPVAKSALFTKYASDCVKFKATKPAGDNGRPLWSNVLTADVTLSNAQNGNVLNLPMTALSNVQSNIYENIGAPSTFFTMNASLGGANTGNGKARVEDALWANGFVVPYNVSSGNQTYATVTFPTKETYALSAGTQYDGFLPGGRAPTVAIQIRDEQENMIGVAGCLVSPCPVTPSNSLPNEVNVIAVATGTGSNTSGAVFTRDYTRGWLNVNIEPDTSVARSNANFNNFGRSGAPALATVINWVTRGSVLQGTWGYAPKVQEPGAN